MNHIHFDECSSTQTYIKELIEQTNEKNFQEVLVSTALQTGGRGRQGNQWVHLENSLALSFSVEVKEQITLIPLELGLLVSDFLERKFQQRVFLKWPNDLLNEKGEKIGGLICQLIHSKLAICGVGINLGKSKNEIERDQFPIGSLVNDLKLDSTQNKALSLELYQSILSSRKSNSETIEQWPKKCFHSNQKVLIKDDKNTAEGIFVGIGPIGEALIQTDNVVKKVYSGSLLLSN